MNRKKRRSVSGKAFAALLAAVLIVGCAIGGTVAWLVDNTAPVVNTFTYGDINIELTETPRASYKIVPGNNIPKDPMVTVKANSEACWLFVKVEEANWPSFTETDGTTRKVNYAIADGWTAGTGTGTGGNGVPVGVYYREVGATTSETSYSVLLGDKITVSGTLTKGEVNSVTATPTLTFTAYAVQQANGDSTFTAAQAWAIANPANP